MGIGDSWRWYRVREGSFQRGAASVSAVFRLWLDIGFMIVLSHVVVHERHSIVPCELVYSESYMEDKDSRITLQNDPPCCMFGFARHRH